MATDVQHTNCISFVEYKLEVNPYSMHQIISPMFTNKRCASKDQKNNTRILFLSVICAHLGSQVWGVIFDPRGNNILSFAWGLGNKTNNQAEWAALMQGIESMKKIKIYNFQVFGDSWIVIQKTKNIQDGKQEAKGRVQKRILSQIQDLSKVKFFHIKRKK